MVTREIIQAEKDRWSEIPEADRRPLEDHMRAFLESELAPKERTARVGGRTVDTVEYILADLDSYG